MRSHLSVGPWECLVLLAFLHAIIAPCYGQLTENQIDSIRNSLNSVQDTQLANSYLRLGTSFFVSDEDAKSYMLTCYDLCDSINFDQGKIRSSYVLGSIYHYFQTYDSALFFYKRGLHISRKLNWPNEILRGYGYIPGTFYYTDEMDSALAYNQLFREEAVRQGDSSSLMLSFAKDGGYYFKQARVERALESYIKSSRMAEQLKDSVELIQSFGDIALVLERKGENQDAIGYYRRAIRIATLSKNYFAEIPSLINMSILYRQDNLLDSAEWVLDKAEEILRKNDPAGKMDIFIYNLSRLNTRLNHAHVFAEQGRYQRALEYCSSIENEFKDYLNENRTGILYMVQAIAYKGKGEDHTAFQKGLQAKTIFEKNNNTENLLEVISLLILIDVERSDYRSAFQLQQQYISVKDSVNESENKEAYKALLVEYETENREREIAELKQEKLEGENRRNILIASLAGMFILTLGIILFLQYRATKNKELFEQGMELDRMKSRFFTDISHEFRTPLTIILGMAEQIQQFPEKWLDNGVSLVKRNGQILLNLINQILDLRKLEAKQMKLELIQGDFIFYLRYIQTSFHSIAEPKNIQLLFEAEEDSFIMDYDPGKWMAIITNLLSNAIKFTPEGGIIKTRISTVNQEVLRVSIQDNGRGIPQEQIPHIFDRFFQVSENNPQPSGGTGIGLALVYEMVHLMKGEISVESVEGNGAAFIIQIPISNEAPIHSQSVQPEFPIPQPLDQPITFSEPPTEDIPQILLVDDNEDVLIYLQSCLEGKFRITTAVNGKVGTDLAIETIPDLIISDVMMPEKDGLELCQELKQHESTSHIPIILLTAKADVESRIQGWDRGADSYLAKPFNQIELISIVQSLLASRKALHDRYQYLTGKILVPDPQLNPEDAFVNKLQKIVLEHLPEENFKVPELCKAIGMSRTQLHNKVKALTGQSTSLYVRSIRLEKAKDLLLNSDLNITEISYAVGFSELSYFSKLFTDAYGTRPSAFRNN